MCDACRAASHRTICSLYEFLLHFYQYKQQQQQQPPNKRNLDSSPPKYSHDLVECYECCAVHSNKMYYTFFCLARRHVNIADILFLDISHQPTKHIFLLWPRNPRKKEPNKKEMNILQDTMYEEKLSGFDLAGYLTAWPASELENRYWYNQTKNQSFGWRILRLDFIVLTRVKIYEWKCHFERVTRNLGRFYLFEIESTRLHQSNDTDTTILKTQLTQKWLGIDSVDSDSQRFEAYPNSLLMNGNEPQTNFRLLSCGSFSFISLSVKQNCQII